MKTLEDVYFKHLNFHPRIIVTRHACERLIERKIDVENFMLLLKDVKRTMCVRIYECTLRRNGTIVIGYGIKLPLSFQAESMKIFIRTVY